MNITEKKRCVEEATYELFLEKGYDATSIRMICNKAKVDAPTFNMFLAKRGCFSQYQLIVR